MSLLIAIKYGAIFIEASIILLITTWAFFLAVMHLRDAKDAGRLAADGIQRQMSEFILVLGLILDFLCNMIPATAYFMDLPQEALLTMRLSRYIHNNTDWRKTKALWLCTKLLSTFDSTQNHCGEKNK